MNIQRTIEVDNNSLSFPANWEEGSTVNKQEFTVTVDGKDYGGGFRYEVSESDWFDVVLTGNTFTVIVKENFDINDRNGYILLHHNCIQGEMGEIEVNIDQTGIECSVTVSEENVMFTTVPANTEIKNITVTAEGGNGKFFIKSFRKFHVDAENNEETPIPNDLGIKLVKNGNESITITNYGRTSLQSGDIFKIELAHDNDAKNPATVTVGYYDEN